MSLQTLPQVVLGDILEEVCQWIVKDLTTLDPEHTTSYARLLCQFRGLHLVSRSFHALLTHYVRVDGKTIRKRILELQMQKLTALLELIPMVAIREGSRPVLLHPSTVIQTCGFVWKNPLVFDVLPHLFHTKLFLSPDAAIVFLYWAPEACKEFLMETRDTDSKELPSEDEYESQNSENKAQATRDLNNLVYGKTYKSKTQNLWKSPGIQFVVGRYRFPFTIQYNDPLLPDIYY